jgi:hypothetical protein
LGGLRGCLLYDARVASALKIIRKSSFTAQPWKNGAGITHEAIRVPPGGDPFLWRVSLAHIDAPGPFSDFAGFNRNMVLLRGSGLALKFGNGDGRVLRHIGDLAEFDGAVAAHCELLDGPCVDLNFIVSKSLRADVRIERFSEGLALRASKSESILILSIAEPLMVDVGAGQPERLEPWDLAVLSEASAQIAKPAPCKDSAPGAVFFAAVYR